MSATVRIRSAHSREVLAFVQTDHDAEPVRVRWRKTRGNAWRCDVHGGSPHASCVHATAVVLELAQEGANHG